MPALLLASLLAAAAGAGGAPDAPAGALAPWSGRWEAEECWEGTIPGDLHCVAYRLEVRPGGAARVEADGYLTRLRTTARARVAQGRLQVAFERLEESDLPVQLRRGTLLLELSREHGRPRTTWRGLPKVTSGAPQFEQVAGAGPPPRRTARW